jgi:hypothetical protein
MVIFCCTQKLAKKFKLSLEKDCKETSTNTLGDWYFNYFIFARKYYLLGMCEKSLLPVIIPAKEIKDFPARFRGELTKILEFIEIGKQEIDEETTTMREIRFAVTKSRTVLGCQNDCIRLLPHILEEKPHSSLLEISLKLGKIPFKSINYTNSIEVTREYFS